MLRRTQFLTMSFAMLAFSALTLASEPEGHAALPHKFATRLVTWQ